MHFSLPQLFVLFNVLKVCRQGHICKKKKKSKKNRLVLKPLSLCIPSLSHPRKIKFQFEFLCRSCLSVCLCLPLCLSAVSVSLCLSFFRLIFVAGAAVCTAVSQVSHFRCSALSKTQVINSPRKCHLSFRRRRKSLSVIRPGLCRGFTPSFTPLPPHPPPHHAPSPSPPVFNFQVPTIVVNPSSRFCLCLSEK